MKLYPHTIKINGTIFYLLIICEIQRNRGINSYIEYRLQVRALSDEYNLDKFYTNYLEIKWILM